MNTKYKLAWNSEWVVIAGLTILVLLLRSPFLEEPFESDSGANAYHARLIVRGEPLYGTHHPAHHMPAVYYIYALVFRLLGDGAAPVKFVLIPWTILTAYLIYLIGKIFNRSTGILAAVFFSVLVSQIWMQGSTAEIELFANLPRVAAVLVVIALLGRNSPDWQFLFVGILCGIAFLLKAVYLDLVFITGLAIVFYSFKVKSQAHTWRRVFFRGVWIGVGFTTALVPVVLYFHSLDLLPRFFQVFSLGFGYVSVEPEYLPLIFIPIIPMAILALNNIVMLLLSFFGLFSFGNIVRKISVENDRVWISAVVIIMWYLSSWIIAGVSRIGLPHYALLLAPPLSLAAAWEIVRVHRNYMAKKNVSSSRFMITPGVILIALILLISSYQNSGYYFHYLRYKTGGESYIDYLSNASPLSAEYITMKQVADYINVNSSPEDYIYNWSEQAQLYYYADRRAPLEVPWPVYVEAFDSHEQIFSSNTRYIVLDETYYAEGHPEWMEEGLSNSYFLEKVIKDQYLYRRID